MACLLAIGLPTVGFAESILKNDRYILEVAPDGAVTVEVASFPSQQLHPEFTVLWSAANPGLIRYPSHPNYVVAPRPALRWHDENEPAKDINAWLASPGFKAATGLVGEVKGKEGGGRDWEFRDAEGKVVVRVTGPRAMETSHPFVVGHRIVMQAIRHTVSDRQIQWEFAPQPQGILRAELTLPPGTADPQITYTITPAIDAFFSVAFTGAPAIAFGATLSIPQECDARTHKQFNFVMSEPDLHLPRVQVATTAGNIALAVDPAECRFRLPTIEDARFGAMLEQKEGFLRPVLLAPLLGGAESRMEVGHSWSFTFRYIQRAGDWKETYAYIAREIQGLRDQRDNSGAGPLNAALEHAVDFLSDQNGHNYALWDREQKYYDYFSDKTGIFKPFSPLYGLSVAIVTDDERLFKTRGLPAMEYALSRRFSVFAPYDNSDNKQANSAVRTVGAPYLAYAQLLSLHELLQRRTPALRDLAEKRGADTKSVSDALACWRLTGDATTLAKARTNSAKLSGRTEDELFDLLDLADASGNPVDLRAALDAAYQNAAQKWNLYPVPPDSLVTVDAGGQAPVHQHSYGRHRAWGYPPPQPVAVPQQIVPAWRVARLGVPGIAYPMEYWMNTHGATLRIAGLAQDPFLRDLAHWGMVGRFGNYAGDNRSKESLIAERSDVVEVPPWKWNFATVNPGHAWDFVAALLDFLVSDAFERSKGAIDFPAVSAAKSAFRVRIYGAGPGRFYGDAKVYLWLPRGLLTTSNPQCDWLAGYGNGQLYLALWNQSFQEETVAVTIDRTLAECDASQAARVWRNSAPAPSLSVADNRFTTTLPAKGIVALAIPAKVKPRLQAALYAPTLPALGASSFCTVNSVFSPVHAMLISAGRGLTSAFVYTEALPERVIAARLRWKQGNGEWQEISDSIYPYEFSPVLDDEGDFACVLEIEDARQKILRSPLLILSPSGTAPTQVALPPEEPFPPLPPAVAKETPSHPPPSADFVAYLKNAANPDNFGLRNGRYYPYSTPQGRRIAWRQPVWDKALYAQGCTSQEAERHLLADLARSQSELQERLAARKPAVDFFHLNQRQQETLLDLACTEGASHLAPELVDAVLAENWPRLIEGHLYVRYAGHAPDHLRNKAFAQRWGIE